MNAMANASKATPRRRWPGFGFTGKRDIRLPLATRLTLSFLSIIILSSVIFTIVGVQIITNRVVAEAQERIRTDLNAAREIYLSKLVHVSDAARFTTVRLFLKDIIDGDLDQKYVNELTRFKASEGLDVLTITDSRGIVVLRTGNPAYRGDDQSNDEIVSVVLSTRRPAAGNVIVPAEELQKESSLLVGRAHFVFIETPMARFRPETEETAGMMLKAAAPVLDDQNNLIGVVYAGVLLNRNYEIVDKVKQTIFQDVVYEGKDIGTVTIFQDEVRISTNVRNEDGTRAIGTRIAEEVYDQVVINGEPWIGRAYVVNDWYITAYEPIKNFSGSTIGVLYVGILEQKYTDIRNRTVLTFLGITLAGALLAILVSLLLSRSLSIPIGRLVSASRELARGNLETKVETTSRDELGVLADTFNIMAAALKDRDEKIKEFTRRKIMESERLALIGQLAANVAHELNNPLQGIVIYSHLLLEKDTGDDSARQNVEKIATQADRCRDIIRGLLDFSRQKKPDKTRCSVNVLLRDCISLVEKQALFHNIRITLDLDPALPMVIIDPSQIERVFLNLIINAAEAMGDAGQLTLTTRPSSAKDGIEIDVADTGHGISAENLERIFDPFFTTKETGHGVGLGLAISYGIIREHGGAICVESGVGKGATFTISLPITAEAHADNGRQAKDSNH